MGLSSTHCRTTSPTDLEVSNMVNVAEESIGDNIIISWSEAADPPSERDGDTSTTQHSGNKDLKFHG